MHAMCVVFVLGSVPLACPAFSMRSVRLAERIGAGEGACADQGGSVEVRPKMKRAIGAACRVLHEGACSGVRKGAVR